MNEKINEILDNAYKEGRKNLTEIEVYEIFKILKLNVPFYIYKDVKNLDVDLFSDEIYKSFSNKIVIKIVSSTNLHKTDSGGVKVVEKNKELIKKTVGELLKFSDLSGIAAIEFLPHSPFSLGEELLLGAKSDDAYGPIVTLAPGGTHTESFLKALKSDSAPSFLPVMNLNGSGDIVDFTDNVWILNYCFGKVRGLKQLVQKDEIIKWLDAFIGLMKDFNDDKVGYSIEEIEVNPLALSNGKFYALDGVLRFRESKNKKRDIPSRNAIKSILEPETIAVVGVSEKKMNMARIILNNIFKAGFPKEKIFIIKEGVDEIDGVKAYKSIKDIPVEKIDMYVVSVPVEGVIDVLDDVAESKKANGIVLITGGIGEKSGTENVAENLIAVIKKARKNNPDFGLNGGNCMGMVLNKTEILSNQEDSVISKGINTFFIPEYKLKYPIGFNPDMVKTGFISQSGAFTLAVLSKIPHIIPEYTVTVGNQQDITVVDYLDYVVDSDIKLILTYIEGFKYHDGLRLLNIIKRAKRSGKTFVLYKAGRTSAGQKAVMGHTASIAGDYIISEKLLKEAGAIVCDNFEEFCDMAYLSSYILKYDREYKNVFMMSNAGFETTGMADNLLRLKAAEAGEELKKKMIDVLKKYKLDTIVDFKNPMDTTPMANDEAITEIVKNVASSGDYSAVFISMAPFSPNINTLPASERYPDIIEKSFIKNVSDVMKETKVPVILSVSGGVIYEPYVEYAIKNGFVVFRNADKMIKTFEKFVSSR
ncbi:MAG: hypothetical protein GX445_04695 [Elusimicrobia bacterium]|nr:hypothetical protein [Elusimicrobiota bacterium]